MNQSLGGAGTSRDVRVAGDRRPFKYALAAGLVLLSFALRVTFPGAFWAPFILFYPVVLLTGFYAGRGPGLLATGLASTLAAFYVLPSTSLSGRLGVPELTALSIFTATGVLASVLAERYHRGVAALAELEKQAALQRMGAQLAATRERAELSAAQLQAVFDALADGVLVIDHGGRVVMANQALAALSGFASPAELPADVRAMTRTFELLTPSGSVLPASGWPMARVARGERFRDLELRRCRRDTGQRWIISFSGEPVLDAHGQHVFSVIVLRDRTVAHEAAEALAASEARFRSWAEHAPHAILVMDKAGRLLDSNSAAAPLFAVTPGELESTTLESLLGEAAAREALRTVAEGRRFEVVTTLRREAGATVEVSVSVVAASADRVMAFCQDVTERVRLERLFRQAQKLESIGRLAGGVAHDFNNLLTVILSCAASLTDRMKAGQPPDPEELEDINSAGERAQVLTRQLLLFARQKPVSTTVLDANAVVRGSEGLLRRVLGEDVALEVMLGADLWPICWDPGHLEQVLMNLVVNARDAMLQGGRLRLSTRNERVGEEAVVPAGDWVVVQVKDWGTGMSAEVKAHLFEPFFTTKEHGRGTGLGLATIYGLVTQAGGNVQVDSELGQGTSIDVFLPRSAATGAVVAPAAALRARGGDETVLVVEDDPMVRAVTTRALVAGGYRVLVAGEGAEALKLARQQRVDLVVSDVVMPGVDGPTLVKALRTESPSLRALLVSGYTHDVLEDHDVEASGLQFLTKPFTGQALLTKVRAVLDARERGGVTPVPK